MEKESINFKITFEYISRFVVYRIIAYILPIMLDKKVLNILGGSFKIVPVANRII